MRETSVLIHDIGLLITKTAQVGVGLRVNYALSLLGKVLHHLSDRQLGSPRNKESDFHIWGDIASQHGRYLRQSSERTRQGNYG